MAMQKYFALTPKCNVYVAIQNDTICLRITESITASQRTSFIAIGRLAAFACFYGFNFECQFTIDGFFIFEKFFKQSFPTF